MKKAILVLAIISLLAACVPLDPTTLEHVSFRDLMANKAAFYGGFQSSKAFNDGVVIFVSEDEDFFAVTYSPVPEVSSDELEDNMYMMVKGSNEGLAIGDIVTVVGTVNDAEGELENGEEVTVYYLDTTWSEDIYVTGRVDTTDPDFEKIVEIINNHESQEWLQWYILWFVIIMPTILNSND